MTATLPTTPAEPARRGGRRPRWWLVAALVVVGVLAGGAGGYALASNSPDQAANQAPDGAEMQAMDARAAQVMGFDLAATQHTFTKTPDGGVEQVVVDNPTERAGPRRRRRPGSLGRAGPRPAGAWVVLVAVPTLMLRADPVLPPDHLHLAPYSSRQLSRAAERSPFRWPVSPGRSPMTPVPC